MRQTVVGVFDRYAAARQAAQQLRDSGFGDSVYVTDELEGDTAAGSRTEAREEGGVMAHVRNFFSDLFGSDEKEVSPYAEAVRRGGAVVKVEVDADEEAEAARSALEAAGAVDIDERASEWRASGWQEGSSLMPAAGATGGTAAGLTPGSSAVDEDLDDDVEDTAAARSSRAAARENLSATSAARDTSDEQVIPVVKEELQVGKRLVRTGGVRVYAHTVETPVQESLELRSERAEVERRPVDRPASEADLRDLADRTIEVRETAEEPVIAKQARVVEEVRVGKTVDTRTEQVRDTVRSTDVQVEPLRGEGGTGRGLARDLGSDVDTGAWRSHFDTTYASSGGLWEDYEPAYRWGDAMRSDSRYRGRSWDEVEPDLQRDWEGRQAGPWERFKAAVRHAWDRMTD